MPRISAIIPIYNVAPYLRECLDSVINQTFKDIEIICIDDGSTDKSVDILKEYAQKDERIIAIFQKHEGAAKARNKGLDLAQGAYLSFLDSDDYFALDMFEKMLVNAEKTDSDITICSMQYLDNQTKKISKPHALPFMKNFTHKEVFSPQDIAPYLFNFTIGWVWDKLYKASFIKSHALYFQEIRSTNDLYFAFVSLTLAKKISRLESVFITYRKNTKNQLSTTRQESPFCFLEAIYALTDQLKSQKLYDIFEQSYMNFLVQFSFWHIDTINIANKSKIEEKIYNKLFVELNIYSQIFNPEYFYDKNLYSRLCNTINIPETLKVHNKPTLKILVCYHKPAQLKKDAIYVPIHVGRAQATQPSKNGSIDNNDYTWMLENMIGDDTGDNISHLNRHFAELTAIYWAWKNYDILGNPDYIGLEHYRRHFKSETILNFDKYDISAPSEDCYNVLQQFKINHYSDKLELAFDSVMDKYPEMKESFSAFCEEKNTFFYNMFIMKKELFFEYCEFLFNIVVPIHKNTDYSKESLYNQRLPGFLTERLGSFFFFHKSLYNFKVHSCNVAFKDVSFPVSLKPAFEEKSINICLASDNNYAPYLAVTITSIKENAKNDDNYDICILSDNISLVNQAKIQSIASKQFAIRFIDMNGYLANFDERIFHLNKHYSIATYFRFFIPQIFIEYDRVLYLDCDLIVNSELSPLFYSDLDSKCLGAVIDVDMSRALHIDQCFDKKMQTYLTQTLKMKNPDTYFQAGVLLLDIQKLQAMDFTNACIKKLIEIKDPKYAHQCILNSLFDGNIAFFDLAWNVEWHLPIFAPNYHAQLPMPFYLDYQEARKQPKIIHYCDIIKPWKFFREGLAHIWWKYAHLTSFYEDIILNMITENTNIRELKTSLTTLLREKSDFYAVQDLLMDISESSTYWHTPQAQLALIHEAKGEHDVAIEYTKNALYYEPNNRMHTILLANLLRKNGDFDAVIELMTEAQKRIPVWSEPQAQFAMIHEAKGEMDQALECANKALEIAPNNTLRQDYLEYILRKIS